VIIGDKGFEADGTGLIDIDLGNAWTDMTGLPFVWAMWLGKKEAKLNSKLLFWLLQCAYNASGFRPLHDFIDPQGKYASDYKKEYVESHCQKTKSRRSFVIESAVRRSSWTHEQVDEYLSYGVRFDEPKAQYALEKFAELINKHRIAEVEIPLELRSEELRKIVMDMIPEIA
jgi:predicted solute-binding protein